MNSSLNNQENRRQKAQNFFFKIEKDFNNIGPEKFNILLAEAASDGILVKIQEDKRHGLTPAEVYDSFVKKFGSKALVIENISPDSPSQYYKLRDPFMRSHFNVGKDILHLLKTIEARLIHKTKKTEKRENLLKEMQEFHDAIEDKFERQELKEEDFLQAINLLVDYRIIAEIPENEESYDFYWKHFVPQPEGKPILKTKKYIYTGPKDRNTMEYILFADITGHIKREILHQIHQKRYQKQMEQTNDKPSGHRVDIGGSRKTAKLMIHEIKGESRRDKRRRKKIEKQQRKRREGKYQTKENYFSDDE